MLLADADFRILIRTVRATGVAQGNVRPLLVARWV